MDKFDQAFTLPDSNSTKKRAARKGARSRGWGGGHKTSRMVNIWVHIIHYSSLELFKNVLVREKQHLPASSRALRWVTSEWGALCS